MVEMAVSIASLPEELLTMVLDDVDHVNITQLKDLRLVCAAFAWNSSVLKRFFCKVNIIADVQWIDKLDDTDFGNFSPYVKHITFVPPLHNWLIERTTCRKILHGKCYEVDKHDENADPTERDRSSFLEWPKPREAFYKYDKIADRNYGFLRGRGSTFVTKLVEVLQVLPHCTSFRFGFVDYANLNEDLEPNYPGCIQRQLPESRLALAIDAKDVADIAFGLVLKALIKTQAEIHTIEVINPALGGNTWAAQLRSEQLNLRQLKSLTYHLARAGDSANADLDDTTNQFLWNDVAHLLTKSCSTIKVLHCTGVGTFNLRRNFTIEHVLPNLRELILESGAIHSRILSNWIFGSSKLKRIVLHDVGPRPREGAKGCKNIFDAIRNHSNSIQVEFASLCVPGQDRLCFDLFHTASGPAPSTGVIDPFPGVNEFKYEAAVRLATHYMKGQCRWGGYLPVYFF